MRPSTEAVKKRFGDTPLNCAEIGVWEGNNAMDILNNLNINKLYLIDPYKFYDRLYYYQGEDDEMLKRSQYIKDEVYINTKNDMTNIYGDKVQFIRKMSRDAIDDIPNDMDFIYIDGNHQYLYVKEDIENYFPKLKVGGVCGGHDYHRYQVRMAINEYAHANGLIVHRKSCEDNTDFWIVKK